jgi:hypothetical protein
MHQALTAAACCLLTATPPPLTQSWSDTSLIATDDDWSHVPAIVGHRGDAMTAEPGTDPRTVLADGSATPVDVSANRTDPGAIGLAAGVAEFELPNPVVGLQGSATAAAPHLVIALDTRGRTGIAVRYVLRDIDASAADAAESVALQYRVGETGEFDNAPGGYVADATTGPSEATMVTEVRTVLPAPVDNQPVVYLRVITTDAGGRDEWVGIDDIDVSATAVAPAGDGCADGEPPPAPGPAPPPTPPPAPAPAPDPASRQPQLTGLALVPEAFAPARRGPAIVRRGRSGASLRFRLSTSALVRFRIWGLGRDARVKTDGRRAVRPLPTSGRFHTRGRRGLNRLRLTGRLRGKPLPVGAYVLEAVAIDRAGRMSAPSAVRFSIQKARSSPPAMR